MFLAKKFYNGNFSEPRTNNLIFFAILIVYLPAIWFSYLWSDDYSAYIKPTETGRHAILDGRPLYGLAIEVFFSSVNSVGDLRFIRFVTLLLMYFLMFWVVNYLSPSMSRGQVIIYVLVAFSLPTWSNVVFWGIAFVVPLSALLSCIGLDLTIRGRPILKILGLSLLICGGLVYPPATYFPLVIFFAREYFLMSSPRILGLKIIKGFFIVSTTLFITYIMNKLLIVKLSSTQLNERYQFIAINELLEKSYFFVTRLLVQSFRPFFISSPSIYLVILQFCSILLIIILGIRLNYGTWRDAIRIFVILVLVLTLSLFPFLVARDNQIEIRYFIASNWLVSVIFLWSLWNIVIWTLKSRSNSKNILESFSVLFKLALPIFSLLLSWSFFFSIPYSVYHATSAFLKEELSKCQQLEIDKQILVKRRVETWPSKANIGMGSQITDLASEWVPLNAILTIVDKKGNNKIEVLWAETGSVAKPTDCVVDLNRFKT